MSIEKLIFSNLIVNEEFTRKVIPFLQKDYFSDYSEKIVFELIHDYFTKYNVTPSKESLFIDLTNRSNVNEQGYKDCQNIISNLSLEKSEVAWLTDQTEKFCQEKAIYNAIMKSINILNDKNSKEDKGSIPQFLSDAISVCFDSNIGHDYIEDADKRFEYYHTKENRIPFSINLLNEITRGGLPNKSLSIFMGGVGAGKTLGMCSEAAFQLTAGIDVLYITLEMAAERISERIDANLLDTPLDELILLPKDVYQRKIERIKAKTVGKLIVKEYPPACISAANIRHLLNELKIKKKFIPKIIYVDYINLMASSRLKMGNTVNTYSYIKAIAEELRGISVEFGPPVVSATQLTRSGYTNSDAGIEDTAESFGLPATADFMGTWIASDELATLNQIMFKQLKNRFRDVNINKKFVVGVDRPKMRLYDVEQEAQTLQDDIPVFSTSKFGSEDDERGKKKKKFDFGGFK